MMLKYTKGRVVEEEDDDDETSRILLLNWKKDPDHEAEEGMFRFCDITFNASPLSSTVPKK